MIVEHTFLFTMLFPSIGVSLVRNIFLRMCAADSALLIALRHTLHLCIDYHMPNILFFLLSHIYVYRRRFRFSRIFMSVFDSSNYSSFVLFYRTPKRIDLYFEPFYHFLVYVRPTQKSRQF